MKIRRAVDRGRARFQWLDSAHTFSFGHYYDPAQMGFGVLRVINDDRVAPGGGFPPHSHADMEIVSYVVEGGLEHRDNLGNGSVIRPGDVQRMSAGRGIAHSEMNASRDEGVRFLQIWILPSARRTTPGYEQRHFDDLAGEPIRLVLSPDGEGGSVSLGQDVRMHRARFTDEDGTGEVGFGPSRSAWVQVVRGTVELDGETLSEGDGAAIERAERLSISGDAGAEALIFDLPWVG